MNEKILFLDLECTGLDSSKHMITQIGAEYHVDGRKVDEFFIEMKAMPTQTTAINLGALKITKTTLKGTMTEGQPEAEALIDFVDWLLTLDTDKMAICGHNVHFDIGFMKEVLARYNIEGWDEVVSYRVEDTCSLSRSMIRAGILQEGSVGLGKLANDLGISPPVGQHMHNAATDVRITARVYYKLLRMLRTLSEV